MDYRLENLEPAVFEKLVNTICQKILGTGVISFSQGKDGGRDGVFTGTATDYPSHTQPWQGKFIIQAKHSASSVASCSDAGFQRTIADEFIKLKKLRKSGDADCYLLFTNRKYSGGLGERLREKISEETGIPHVAIIGKETINDMYLNSHRDIVRQYKLDTLHIPFDFSDQDIKDIIMTFKQQLPVIDRDIQRKAEKLKYDFDKIQVAEKNKQNGLGEAYYRQEIMDRSLMDFDKIQAFLSNPINDELKHQYFDIATELGILITIKRSNFAAFEEIFLHIYKLVCDGNTALKGGKRHVFTLLHYMYIECLIGEK